MSSPRTTGHFVTISAAALRHCSRKLACDVFTDDGSGGYRLLFPATAEIDYRLLAKCMATAGTRFLIRPEDEVQFRDFAKVSVEALVLNPELPKEQRVKALKDLAEVTLCEVFQAISVTEDAETTTRKTVLGFVDILGAEPQTFQILLRMLEHSPYLYGHAVATAIFSVLVARASGQFNRRTTELIGLGGFLHDLGCTQLPREITEAAADLTPAQWREMRTHPKLGLRLLEGTANIPDEVRYIIYQHHEEPGGGGYPNGLRGNVIYFPAKIVSVADAYSALITRRPFRPPFSPEQAVHILQSETGKYDPALVQLVAGLFGKGSASSRRAA